jgi:AcrR family transcriptional regulator
MQTTDRRVRRTRRLLGEALIALALENGYENLTVQDVTDRADVGYRTFFRHYSDVDELLLDVVHETRDRLQELLEWPRPSGTVEDACLEAGRNGEIIFRFVQENQDIFRVILLGRGMRFCLAPIIEHVQEQAASIMSDFSGTGTPVEIAANHLVTSMFSLMRWWLANDMAYSPAQMGAIAAELIVQPTWCALGERDELKITEVRDMSGAIP